MDWTTYVRRVVGTDTQTQVAAKTGINQTTISRWLNPDAAEGRRLSSQAVAAFARGYDRKVVEAFVVAGFLTPAEANMTTSEPVDLSEVPRDELLAEIQRRMSS